MGNVVLTSTSCTGEVSHISVSVNFALDGRTMDFVPAYLEDEFDFLPDFVSNYGTLKSATVSGVNYTSIPIVYSTYPIRIGLSFWRWALISAMYFDGTDLQVEIVGTYFGDVLIASSYIYYQGQEYHFNDPALGDTTFNSTGAIVGQDRYFSASIDTIFEIDFYISCAANVNEFAMLDREGYTVIYTTVLGKCTATDLNLGKSYESSGTSLLETKNYG